MKIREKIEVIGIYYLFSGRVLSNVIDTLIAKKMKAYKDGYLNLELELEYTYCHECSGYEEVNLFGTREETQKEQEKRLNKNKKSKEQRVKAQKTQDDKDMAIIAKLAKKHNLTVEKQK